MCRLVRTLYGLSAATMLAAVTASGLGAQAEPKKQPPPAAEKKQPPPAAEKKQPPAAPEKKQAATAAPKVMNTADITWGPAPPGLPAELQAAVLDGDPGKAGLFTVRLKAPDGLQIMPHFHPSDERVTVISGAALVGTGQTWDDSAMQTLNAGGYVNLPRKQSHYVRIKGETILQITAMGPFGVTYVKPGDDPRKKKTGN